MNAQKLQYLWDSELIQAFYLKPEYKFMHEFVNQFSKTHNIEEDILFSLNLKRFPLKTFKHLSLSPHTFVCSYLPHLAKHLWENSTKSEIISTIDNIECQLEKKPANVKYENDAPTKNKKKSQAAIGRNAIATNRLFEETKKINLGWSKK